MADVLVVGAGIVGASCAYALARGGAHVDVIDASLPGQATQAATGMISPGTVMLRELVRPSGFLPLAFQAGAFYAHLREWLAEDGEPDSSYEQVGSLIVAQDEVEAGELPELVQALEERRAEGVALIGDIESFDANAARKLFPPLSSDLAGVIRISAAARVEGRRLLEALRRAAERRGATFRHAVGRLSAQSATGNAVMTVDGDVYSGGPVILTSGAWWLGSSDGCRHEPPVTPLRGQVVYLQLDGVDTAHWPTVRGFTHTSYMVPLRGSRVVVGATREPNAGFDARSTAQAAYEVLDGALRIAPGLGRASILEQRVGLRPMACDGLPAIGPLPRALDVYVCAGHGAYGLLMGPCSGAAVANLVLGTEPGIDLAPFDPARFGPQLTRLELST